jgi:hypothetical protein
MGEDDWGSRAQDALQLPGGEVWVTAREQGEFEPETFQTIRGATVLAVSSADNGATWSEPITLFESTDWGGAQASRLAMSSGGRIVHAVSEWATYPQIWLSYSDDNGVTWNSTALSRGGGDVDLSATPDGGFLMSYWREQWYYMRTSADGVRWSEEKSITRDLEQVRWNDELVVLPLTTTEYLAAFVRYTDATETLELMQMKGFDSGTTWSAASPVVSCDPTYFCLNYPDLVRDAGGEVWLAYQYEVDFQSLDIWYTTSQNDGTDWTAPEILTNYVGFDGSPRTALVDGNPFVTFSADRVTMAAKPVAGFLAQGADSNPALLPPVVNPTNFLWDGVSPNTPFSVAVLARDETGITGVEIAYSVNDGTATTVPATDMGDGVWSAELPGRQLGDVVGYHGIATDTDGNVRTSWTFNLPVQAFHDVGEIFTPVPGGFLPRVEWPAGSGDDYLWTGELWVGSNGVVTWAWERDGSVYTEGPGASDDDVVVGIQPAEWLAPEEKLGVLVKQKSYQWMSDGSATGPQHGLAFEYEVTNDGSQGDMAEVFVGLYLDPDILLWTSWDDQIGYDASRGLFYMYYSGDVCAVEPEISCTDGYLGVAVFGSPGTAAAKSEQPYTATWWNAQGIFDVMTSGINTDLTSGVPLDPGDYNMIFTAQPFALNAGATKTVTIGLAMGNGLPELMANMDALEGAYRSQVVAVDEPGSATLPQEFALEQNYPNPFNPSTRISYSLPKAGHVELTVYNVLGEAVQTLVSEDRPAGSYDVTWDASGLASGMYFYRLTAGSDFTATKSLVLLK